MTAIALRILTYVIIGALIWFAVRRLVSGPKPPPRATPREQKPEPDKTIELEKGKDGVFRPTGKAKDDGKKR